ncbi:MAG: aldo/keto reductase [Candidatus Aminicenantaceae bacterium]
MVKKIKTISRKEFLKKASFTFLGMGLLKNERPAFLFPGKQKSVHFPLRTLGRTGIRVTPVGYGASRTMESSLIRRAIDKGINFIDTGRHYFNGQNEYAVGKAIKGIRKNIVIQSKISIRSNNRNKLLKSSQEALEIIKSMESSLNKSLGALQTDYIDIILFHSARSSEIIHHEMVMNFFKKAKESGKIRAYGFSSHSNQVELLREANKKNFYEVIMVPYNHKGSYIHSGSGHSSEWNQKELEIELKKVQTNNIGIVAMKTCSAGPYSPSKNIKPSYKEALKWILKNSSVSTMASAMTNYKEMDEDIQAMM